MNSQDYDQSRVDGPFLDGRLSRSMPVWKEILLWIAILPACFLGSAVMFWIAELFIWLGSSYYGNDTWLYVLWRKVVTHGACGYAFIYCGAYVAPRGKIAVAVTLAGLALLLYGTGVLLFIRDHRWMDLLGIASLIGGIVICAVQIAKGEKRF